jgi:cell division septal protein FtsQ
MSLFSSSNRRIKKTATRRSHNPLEISGRPDRERSHVVRKRFRTLLKVLALAGLSVGAVFAGRAGMKRFVWENPTYALSDLRISSDGLLTRLQILEVAGIQEGENIFRVDLHKAKMALDQIPQIERVEIRRVLPDRVDIRISERQPLAWVAASTSVRLGVGSDAYLVDARGYVMRPRKVMPEHLALPVITGVFMEDVAPGQKLPSAEAVAAVELIRLSAEDLRWQPRVVDISKGYCLSVIDNRKARITFGFDALEEQLFKLRQLIELVEPTQKEFVSVNLMLEKSVPVVFAAPLPAVPPSDAKNGKSKGGASKPSVGGGIQKAVVDTTLPVHAVDGASAQSASGGAVDLTSISVSGGVVEPGEESRVKPPASQNPKVGSGLVEGVAKAVSAKETVPKNFVKNSPPVSNAERSGNKADEENQSASRVRPSTKPSASRAPVSVPDAGSVNGVAGFRESSSKMTSSKSTKSKAVSSPVRVRKVPATSPVVVERDVPSPAPRAVRGVGPVSKGAAPSTGRPSLNPSEALRKLFSPHG